MARILHLKVSPRPVGESSSATLAAEFLASCRQARPADTVTTLDLATAPIPEFGEEAARGKYKLLHGQPHSAADAAAWRAVEAEAARFKEADKLVLSCPMWNFGVPYRLKQYLDVIVQPGLTFSFNPAQGFAGLVTGRPAVLILSRGGAYSVPALRPMDFQRPYLEQILRFIGFSDLRVVVAEPLLAAGPAGKEAALAQARASLAALVAAF